MTSLQNLQAKARVKWGIEVGPNSTQRGQEQVLLDIMEGVWTSALQESLGKVPGTKNKDSVTAIGAIDQFAQTGRGVGWNACRTETIQGIESLFPKKDI